MSGDLFGDAYAAAAQAQARTYFEAEHPEQVQRLEPPSADDGAQDADVAANPLFDGSRELVLTPASTIKPRRVKWAWLGRIALGTLALLAGPEGLGKSTLAYWIAGRITRGELPGENEGTPRGVLVCATEDSWEHTIVPRLMAADADLDRVFRVEVRMAHDIHVGLSLPRDLTAVEAAAAQVDAALLILDPLMSRLDANLDTHRDGEVRRALEPLAALADRASMAVLGLIHHNKSGSADPLQVVMASKAFTAVARSVHSVIRDPDDDTDARRLFGTPKNNLGRTDQPTLSFTIASHAVDTEDGTAWTGRVEWAGEVVGTIRDAMSRSNDGDRTATAEAGDWLSDYLASRGGEASSADVKKAGATAGHSQDSLKRAKRRLGVVDRSEGFPRRTLWALPTVGAPVSAQSAQDSRGDAPTALTEYVSAPTAQVSAQSVQSVQSERLGQTGAPTVASAPLDHLDEDDCCPDCCQPYDGPPGAGCQVVDLHPVEVLAS